MIAGDSEQRFRREVARRARELRLQGPLKVPWGFFGDAVAIAALSHQHLDAWCWARLLPGLGIQSDFSFMADPVALGSTLRPRHDVALVLGICLVNSWTGSLQADMWDGWSMPFGAHGATELFELLLRMILSHPAAFDLAKLRQGLAALIGDGGLTKGGPAARHKVRYSYLT